MRRVAFGVVLACGVLLGCNFSQAGIDTPPNTLNFPMAVELSAAVNADGEPEYLFVANSNYNLKFNGGSLMAIDLDAVETAIAGQCAGVGSDCELWPLVATSAGSTMVDGRMTVPVIADEVGIGSHADGMALNAAGDRIYLPVRGEGDLTFVPFDAGQGVFRCDQELREGADGDPTRDIPRCADRFRTEYLSEVSSERELALTGSPVAVGTGSLRELGSEVDADYVLMAQTNGTIALYLDRLDGRDGRPELVHVAEGFPQNMVTLTPQPGLGVAWMTSVGTSTLPRVGISVDPVEPSRSFLYNFGSVRLGGVDDGEDTRDLVFHPTDPGRAFILARRPEAVIEVAVERRGLTQSDVAVVDAWEVGAGPSRLAVAELGGTTYAFASCFDAQRLFVIDADHGALVAVVGGFSGPFEITVDTERERLYMADFSTSVIRVVDLEGLGTGGSPRVIARLGEIRPISSVTD